MTAGGGRTVTWTSFDMVRTITAGALSTSFDYDGQTVAQQVTFLDGWGVVSSTQELPLVEGIEPAAPTLDDAVGPRVLHLVAVVLDAVGRWEELIGD